MHVEKKILSSTVATYGPIGVPQSLMGHDFLICLHLWTMYMYISVKVLHGAVALVCMHMMPLNHY